MNHSDVEPKSHNSPWNIIKPVKGTIYLAMTVAGIGGILGIASFYLMALLFDDYLNSNSVNWSLFAWLMGLVIVGMLLRGMAFKISHAAAFTLEPILRNNITQHLTKISLGSVNEVGNASLIKIIQDDVKDLHVFVADSTPLFARAYATPIVTAVAIFLIDWRLALVAAGVLLLGMLLMSLVIRRAQMGLSDEYNRARESVNASIIEFIQAMPEVRTFDSGEASFSRYEKALDNYLDIMTRWFKQNGLPSRLSMFLLNPMPTLLALLWTGAYLVYGDSADFTTWLAVLLLGTGMAESLMPFMSLFHNIQKSKLSIERINQVMELPILVEHSPAQVPQDASVSFEQVDFCYATRAENALSDISFSVPSGSFTALVGGSGAGKSTVAKLIPRFWDATQGVIKIGGADVKHIPNTLLMEQVAFVFQDNFLFSGSIADNISLGMDNVSEAEIITAAQAAQAHDFISDLPNGYNTQVGERGASLSGGQRQRITIARAILQNRPILVLDEATAFTDAENEALLMKALHALMQGKTVLMIAHRLKTIANADQVLVFKHGRLVESGQPNKLLEQDGEYAKLWQAYETAQQWTISN